MTSPLRPTRRARRHGRTLLPVDRRALERDGWRTTLEFRENHVRDLDGRLLRVEPLWIAEAERYGDRVAVATVEAATAAAAWRRLRDLVAAERSVDATGRAGIRPAPASG